KQNLRSDIDAPEHLSGVCGQAIDPASGRADERLAVYQRGRRRQAIGLLAFLLLVQVPFPDDFFTLGIDALQSVAHGTVQVAVVDKWLGALVRPDAANRALAEVAHRLAEFGIGRRRGESNCSVLGLLGLFQRLGRVLCVIQVVGYALGGLQVLDLARLAGSPRGKLLLLLLDLLSLLLYTYLPPPSA